jgi:cyclic pyranopterin phosphate synthase
VGLQRESGRGNGDGVIHEARVQPENLRDTHGRVIDYLRVSVTDRCDLRCVYCTPGPRRRPAAEPLSDDEILRVVRAAARLGVRRVRLTGGEPTLRRGLTRLVADIAGVDSVEEVSLTTNGQRLARMAGELAEAGLRRVNVSLDSLRPERYRQITRGGDLGRVLDGLAAAEAAGLSPIKLNAVVVRGVNDDELLDLARTSVEHPWHMRFIELMPVGNRRDWGAGFPGPDNRFMPVAEMRHRLAGMTLEPVGSPAGGGPARSFRLPGAPGTLGFIAPLSERFCRSCNRLRLTSDGRLRPCLLAGADLSIRAALDSGAELEPLLLQAVAAKPEGHALDRAQPANDLHMCEIGG